MSDLIEAIAGLLSSFIKWAIIDLLVYGFLFWYGYIFLKAATVGSYPKSVMGHRTVCSFTGFVLTVITILIIAYVNSR